MSIYIIDYGVCNASSVQNMLTRIGYPCKIINSPNEITPKSKLILPGIGSFDNGIKNLEKFLWIDYFKNYFDYENQYLLGLCLGMQLLLDESEEGKLKGLGLIPGKVKKLNFDLNNKIPNIGWRNIEILNSNSIINKLEKNDKFYFVHSYFCNVTDDKNIIALSEHTVKFPAIIKKNKIFGCQFHPEKSNIYGMKILENFVNL